MHFGRRVFKILHLLFQPRFLFFQFDNALTFFCSCGDLLVSRRLRFGCILFRLRLFLLEQGELRLFFVPLRLQLTDPRFQLPRGRILYVHPLLDALALRFGNRGKQGELRHTVARVFFKVLVRKPFGNFDVIVRLPLFQPDRLLDILAEICKTRRHIQLSVPHALKFTGKVDKRPARRIPAGNNSPVRCDEVLLFCGQRFLPSVREHQLLKQLVFHDTLLNFCI